MLKFAFQCRVASRPWADIGVDKKVHEYNTETINQK